MGQGTYVLPGRSWEGIATAEQMEESCSRRQSKKIGHLQWYLTRFRWLGTRDLTGIEVIRAEWLQLAFAWAQDFREEDVSGRLLRSRHGGSG